MASRLNNLRISQKVSKCRRNCGFYGNAQFDGLCSKCFREFNNGSKQRLTARLEDATNRKYRNGKEPETTLSRKTHQMKIKESPSTTKDNVYLLKIKQLRAPDEIKEKVLSELQNLDHVIKTVIQCEAYRNIEDLSEIIQKAYRQFSDVLQQYEDNKIITPQCTEDVLVFFEKVIMSQNYNLLFCPFFSNDEEADIIIQERIRQLRWISAKHLACNIDETISEARDLVYCAITELAAIDSYYCPQEKLDCTVRCCRHIFEVLKHTYSGVASADEFFPALIFVVIRTNPVRLHSNINYVNRFANSSKLGSGESGYFFTNLCGAVAFIESLNCDSLGMDEAEFQDYMKSNQLLTTPWETALFGNGTIHFIADYIKTAETFNKRSSSITSGVDQLKIEMQNFETEVSEFLNKISIESPLNVTKLEAYQPSSRKLLIKNVQKNKSHNLPKLKTPEKILTETSSSSENNEINENLNQQNEMETPVNIDLETPIKNIEDNKDLEKTSSENSKDKKIKEESKPQNECYRGFSKYNIPSISCSTGEITSAENLEHPSTFSED